MQRESGYYRVKHKSCEYFTIAQYLPSDKCFWLFGSECEFEEHEFDFIDWDNPIDPTPKNVICQHKEERVIPDEDGEL